MAWRRAACGPRGGASRTAGIRSRASDRHGGDSRVVRAAEQVRAGTQSTPVRPGATGRLDRAERRAGSGPAGGIDRPLRTRPRGAHRRGADVGRRRCRRRHGHDHRRRERLRAAALRGRRDLHLDHRDLPSRRRQRPGHVAARGPLAQPRLHAARARRAARARHHPRPDHGPRGAHRAEQDHHGAAPVPALAGHAGLRRDGRGDRVAHRRRPRAWRPAPRSSPRWSTGSAGC